MLTQRNKAGSPFGLRSKRKGPGESSPRCCPPSWTGAPPTPAGEPDSGQLEEDAGPETPGEKLLPAPAGWRSGAGVQRAHGKHLRLTTGRREGQAGKGAHTGAQELASSLMRKLSSEPGFPCQQRLLNAGAAALLGVWSEAQEPAGRAGPTSKELSKVLSR